MQSYADENHYACQGHGVTSLLRLPSACEGSIYYSLEEQRKTVVVICVQEYHVLQLITACVGRK